MTRRKKLTVIAGCLAFVLLLGLMYIGLRALDHKDRVTGGTEEYDDEYETDNDAEVIFGNNIYVLQHSVKSYLVMGTDASGNENKTGEDYQGSMADFLMLMVIDETDKKYGFLELNRDTITEIPMMDQDGDVIEYEDMQLCTAHWYGGSKIQSCQNTVDTVSTFLHGAPVNGYLEIPIDHISDLNHILEGVEVTLEDDFSTQDPAMTQGATLTLTDEQAYIFLRSRMSVGDGENTSRMRRQRAYLLAALNKISSQNAGDAKFIAKAYKQIMEYATSDLSMNTITKLAKHLDEYENLGFIQISGESTIGTDRVGDGKEHTEFIADEDSVKDAVFTLFPLVDSGIKVDDE